MSNISDAASDVQHKVGASEVLGVLLFWKLSSLSRGKRRLRQKEYLKDVLSSESQISVSERSELRSLVHDCIDRDDVTTLKQLQEIHTLDLNRRFPAFRRRAYEKKALQCAVALSHSSSFYPPQLFSAAFVKQVDRETLKVLIEQGELHLDSWFEVEDGHGQLDVCEWLAVAERDDSALQVSHRSHWETTFFCPGKTPLHSLLLSISRKPTAPSLTEDERHAQKLRLLQRIIAVASKSNTQCVGWQSFIPLSKAEMCNLSLACFLLQFEAVLELLAAREAVLAREEGGRLIAFAMMGLPMGCESDRETQQRCIAVLKALAERGADLSSEISCSGRASSALCEACIKNAESVIDFLLEMGISPKRGKISSPDVPLVLCMQNRRWSIAEKLLSRGADPNEAQWHAGRGVTGPGVLAVEAYLVASARSSYDRQTELRMKVLEGLARAKVDFESPIRDGKHTPLSFAIERRLTEEVEFLLRQGVSVSEEDSQRLFASCMKTEQWSLPKLLLERGADPNKVTVDPRQQTECKTKRLASPLAVGISCLQGVMLRARNIRAERQWGAASSVKSDMIREVESLIVLHLKKGADPNAAGGIEDPHKWARPLADRTTVTSVPLEFALHQCAFFGREWGREVWWRIVTALIQRGARPDLLEGRLRDASPWLNNILCNPSCKGPELEKILRSLPASVANSATRVRLGDPFYTQVLESPLGAALAAHYSEGLKALIEAGADVNVATSTRWAPQRDPIIKPRAPVLLALETRQWEAGEILVQGGADTKCVREAFAGVKGTPACLQDCPATLLSLIWPALTASAPLESG
uniref:Uncharacterized protein n=1 Tax=Chromera velia CCMP2878 TaxID=1169474 RepID=A0A0G4GJS0_9ALVE|eukprot:Cvel_22214.t1-p1 / transcript=Cvel_22214.t1 / gene=Cvel_22214 / organism=Chromera_velia_CCMP2878 / gene_product=hypothetical protein / transcript_product=hypothetical protein / location=Cvel_scaffold2159:15962-18807(-) / protein_length=813 / sequence_SO=supercontig / SO=protein_coding / is_pseudo=false